MKINSLIEELDSLLGAEKIIYGKDLDQKYHHVWKMDEPLKAMAMVMPKNTNEVSEIMKICFKNNQEVIIHGGLTNLVGGTESKRDQLVISLEKMNEIEEIDQKSRTVTVQSGVILENLINSVSEKDLLLPLNFGAKGSAHIGGAISTNAGGLRVLKYGMVRQMILGLEVVLPDGRIVSSLKKIIKDNSGYDLKQFFIGSEGTLGIVTKAVLKLIEAPSTRHSAILGVNDYESVIDLLKTLEKGLGGTLSAFELMWGNTYRTMIKKSTSLISPIDQNYDYYVFVETLGSNKNQDLSLLQNLIEKALEDNIVIDGSLAETEKELNNLWQIREDVSILDSNANHAQHFDISIPIPLIGKIVDSINDNLKKLSFVKNIYIWGHVADGNIHFIVGKEKNSDEIIKKVNEVVYEPLKENNGSISAEHGIGLHKKNYLIKSRTKSEIELMKQIKHFFDPKNILNPGRII